MENLIKLLQEHRSIKKVVEISGRSRRWLIEIAKRNNIQMNPIPISPQEEEEILVLLKEKKNATAVARIVNRGSTTVLKIASNHGIRLKKQRRKRPSKKSKK